MTVHINGSSGGIALHDERGQKLGQMDGDGGAVSGRNIECTAVAGITRFADGDRVLSRLQIRQ